jgi:transcriptional antiterminator RfaH
VIPITNAHYHSSGELVSLWHQKEPSMEPYYPYSGAVAMSESWFCVHSHPKHEHIAAANLRTLLGLEVWNPRIAFTRSTRRGPATVTESVFPGYIFVKFDLDLVLDQVRYTNGVASVVHFGSRYPTIAPAIIEQLKACFGGADLLAAQEEVTPGERLLITEGSFCGIEVVVLRALPSRRRVQVLLDMLGTAATVELDLNSLSFQRRYPRSLSAALPAAA